MVFYSAQPHTAIQQALEGLAYDFSAFELTHFLRHVETYRQRPIVCQGMPLPVGIFGLWIPAETADYLFYTLNTYLVHRTHIILHEVGHMLLKHNTQIMSATELTRLALLLSDGSQPQGLARRIRQYVRSSQEEAEAEDFVHLLQRYVIQANRFRYLVDTSTSIVGLQAFTYSLGFQE